MRACVYCGAAVTSTNPDVTYCAGCYYGGTPIAAENADILAQLPAADYVWHTGGGCFAIRVDIDDTRYIMLTDGDAGLCRDPDEWTVGVYRWDSVADNDVWWMLIAGGDPLTDAIAAVNETFTDPPAIDDPRWETE
jgi:hypothetical protein